MVSKSRTRESTVQAIIADKPVYEFNPLLRVDFTLQSCTKSRKKVRYTNEFLTFDIETTTINKELNIMYIWMVCYNNEFCIYGRTWKDFLSFVDMINSNSLYTIPIYVHNLSYEFQYLRGILEFSDVFCMKSRKVAKATYKKLEFRCSYYLSNMSLAVWGDKLQVAHIKRSGEEFNYRKIRFPNTPLTPKEMEYCIYDIVTLAECVIETLKEYNDNWYTIPMTSTGFVRRDVKKSMDKRKRFIRPIFPDYTLLKLMLEGFRGGDTHANRYYVGIMLSNVHSYDRQSSYIDNLINDEYPMKAFIRIDPSLYNFSKTLRKRRACFITKLVLKNVRLKDKFWGFPYLAFSKVYNCKKYIKDNGRILSAQELTTTITDVDWKIIEKEYDFDIVEVLALYESKYGPLPIELKEVILKYYKLKTSLKKVKGQEVLYNKSKNKLNAVYGMMVQNPLKEKIIYRDFDFYEEEEDEELKMESFYKSSVLSYAWGVWTTAWSRLRLHEALYIAGDRAVYCDTDSVKCIGELDLSEFNADRVEAGNRNNGFAVDRKGCKQYLGVFEHECCYDKFITLGAKKYAYEIEGKLSITIAGVSKKAGAQELQRQGGLENFKIGFVFCNQDQQEWRYNDEPTHTIIYEGNEIVVTPNIAVVPSTYEISMSRDYINLLDDIVQYKIYAYGVDNLA